VVVSICEMYKIDFNSGVALLVQQKRDIGFFNYSGNHNSQIFSFSCKNDRIFTVVLQYPNFVTACDHVLQLLLSS